MTDINKQHEQTSTVPSNTSSPSTPISSTKRNEIKTSSSSLLDTALLSPAFRRIVDDERAEAKQLTEQDQHNDEEKIEENGEENNQEEQFESEIEEENQIEEEQFDDEPTSPVRVKPNKKKQLRQSHTISYKEKIYYILAERYNI